MNTYSSRLALSLFILFALLSSGCVSRYDKQLYDGKLLPPNKDQREAAFNFPYLQRTGQDEVTTILAEWPKVEASCTIVRGAMVSEADGIDTKNRGIGATFTGIAAALALSSGLYSSLAGDDSNPKIAGVLALGATGAAVPTFFYLGSDEREKTVRDRIKAIDDRRLQAEDAWSTLMDADRGLSSADRATKSARDELTLARAGATRCSDVVGEPAQEVCNTAEKALKSAEQAYSEATVRWQQTADAFGAAVIKLQNSCR